MISFSRLAARQARTVFRRALGVSTRGPGPPVTLADDDGQLVLRAVSHIAAVQLCLAEEVSLESSLTVPFELLADCESTRNEPVTLETTQEVLSDLLRANDRRVTIDEIQKKVAEHYNIRVADMHSARRARAVARPRQVAMYLAKQLTARSLPEIGRKFGGRDHTTVMHAVRKVEELCGCDQSFGEDVELLRRMLES